MLLTESLLGTASSTAANYIEDVFSTYLYDGNSSTQTITNGIDLSTKGGLVWIKNRNYIYDHGLFDTARGVGKGLRSNLTNAQFDLPTTTLTAFNSNGFSLGDNVTYNESARTYTSWTFRKQAKFFDVVTWTGNAATPRTITHNLGSIPGCIIVKAYSGTAEDWYVFHRSLGNAGGFAYFCILNSTAAQDTGGNGMESSTAWTATSFRLVSAGGSTLNGSGVNYVAYLFAHNAGGFGAAGTDNVISCGSVSGAPNSTQTVNLGWEPQWILWKPSDDVRNWVISDNMRGLTADGTGSATLAPNLSDAESTSSRVAINATGFTMSMLGTPNPTTSIYIAIRRGPMKTPTSGTSVFVPVAVTGATGGVTMTTNFPADAVLDNKRNGIGEHYLFDRLRSAYGTNYLSTSSTAAEGSGATQYMIMDSNTTVINKDYATDSGNTVVSYIFRRASGFFDVVCYTGTGANRTVSHNLGVAPELMIVKRRNGAAEDWYVYHSAMGSGNFINLDLNAALTSSNQAWNNTSPTSSVFSLGTLGGVNSNTNTFVAYLFATCPGVSKVFSYTGNGSNQTIDCGFTGRPSFVLIKRTDSTGDWYVWDTARGIVSANDPHLSLNSTAAEVTTDDSIDVASSGFIVNQVAATNINVNAATYIGLAIA